MSTLALETHGVTHKWQIVHPFSEFYHPIDCDPWTPGFGTIVGKVCRGYFRNENYHPEIIESAHNALAYIHAAFSRNLSPLYHRDSEDSIFNPVIYLRDNISRLGHPPKLDLVATNGFDFEGMRTKFLDFLRKRYKTLGYHNFSIPDVSKLERIFENNQVVCTDDLSLLFRRFSCLTPEHDVRYLSRVYGFRNRMDGELILTWNQEGEPPYLSIDFAVPYSLDDEWEQGMVKRKTLFGITVHSPDHQFEGNASQQQIEIAGSSDISCLQLLVPLSRIALEHGNYPFSAACFIFNPEINRPIIIAAPDGNHDDALTDKHAEMQVLRDHTELVSNWGSFFSAADPCRACALNIRLVNPGSSRALLRQTRVWNGTPLLGWVSLNEAGLPIVIEPTSQYTNLRRQMLEIFIEANRTKFFNKFNRLIKINSI